MNPKTYPCPAPSSQSKSGSMSHHSVTTNSQQQEEAYFDNAIAPSSPESSLQIHEPQSCCPSSTHPINKNRPWEQEETQHHEPAQMTTSIPPVAYATGPAIPDDKNYVRIESRDPVRLTYCPHCGQKDVMTFTYTKPTGVTALCVGVGVLIFFPLCWVPLCIKPMKQTNHYCQNCSSKVGRVKPFQ
jgi:hypothetical protein